MRGDAAWPLLVRRPTAPGRGGGRGDAGPGEGLLVGVEVAGAAEPPRAPRPGGGPGWPKAARRDERGDLSLAQVAAHAGFSDQSQFSRHFKRLVGATPERFRAPARIA